MNSQAIATLGENNVIPLTAKEMTAHVQRIQQVMAAVMKPGIHYGTIPGAGDKNSLFKPGAEVLCATFHIAPSYRIEDLSDHDSIRYRVTCVGTHQGTGTILGEGMGAASSNEEKYKWRNTVCDEEFEETPEDRKRSKWQRPRGGGEPYRRKMIRTEPADIDNTVLKMACKRAQVAMTINVTAASDIFTQDLEDLPEGMVETGDEGQPRQQASGKPRTQAPQAKTAGAKKCTGPQASMLAKKLEDFGIGAPKFLEHFKVEQVADLPMNQVDEALDWIKAFNGD